MSARPLLAIFVGGKSRRMGAPKGLLEAPATGSSILEHLVSLGHEARFPVALVGDAAPYAALVKNVPRIDDDPPGAGPLGGLHAALRYAAQNEIAEVVTVACDMPFVSLEALAQIAAHPRGAPVVAARRVSDGPWEPMLARYDVPALLDEVDSALRNGCRSFQALFSSLSVEPFPLSPAVDRALRDWDTPDDLGA